MLAFFVNDIKEAMKKAQAFALEYNHGYIGSEHLLLALLHLKDSYAADVLAKVDVTANSNTMIFKNKYFIDSMDFSRRKIQIIFIFR